MRPYTQLADYYKELFNLVDCFHFNSSLTKDIYSQYLEIPQGEVISIAHAGIKDHRQLKQFDNSNLKLGFIGNTTNYKGFPLLKQIVLTLLGEGYCNWSLSVWGAGVNACAECGQIVFRGKYSSHEIQSVFDSMDLLIVPSIWNETFSFITLEALSFGVPVLVSSTVGAKDIVSKYDSSFIFDSEQKLHDKLKEILTDCSSLADYNKKILNVPWNYSMEGHVQRMNEVYKYILTK